MTRKFLVVAASLAGLMATTNQALAHPDAAHHGPLALSPLSRTYLRLYHQVAHSQGDRAPGRNIVRQGLRDGHRPTARHLRASIAVLERMLTPVTTMTVTSTPAAVTPAVSSTPTDSGGGAGGLAACIRQHESGGDYSTNTGNGYYGAYQFDEQTWQAAGGTGNPADASPAEQDAAFQRWYAQHPSAWPVTGPACGG